MTTTRPVALVTGATVGIGRLAAAALTKAGYDVVGTGRRTAGIEPPAGVTLMDLDVRSAESVDETVRRVIARFGRIDVLVNNAGVGLAGATEETSLTQDQQIFDINVFGVMRMTKSVLPHMRAQHHGRIINVSSIFGLIPAPFMATYAATKHAIEGYTESVDHEIREFGVRAVLVEPAGTRTGFDDNTAQADRPLEAYASSRRLVGDVVAEAVNDGDDPALVAAAIVAAATDTAPKLRYPASPRARNLATVRRLVPARMFDKQIRKFNKLPLRAGGDRTSKKETARERLPR
ncbi:MULTISPECIES: oxidoreductase [unclassified Mycobacterium]|uniref:oxidoreductase n=1 Tax=unclassified Mycobacterium TaxID=2642494 RepID=UPI0029C6373B|nr:MULTISPECIES: oxidoreductase [unclassified Mycobacterium]